MAIFTPAMEDRPPGPPSSRRRCVTLGRKGSEEKARRPNVMLTERLSVRNMACISEQLDKERSKEMLCATLQKYDLWNLLQSRNGESDGYRYVPKMRPLVPGTVPVRVVRFL